jgi:hypothetical protein
MKKFLIEESEKTQILMMHKSLFEQADDKPITDDQADEKPITDEQKLRNAISVGCLKNGSLKRQKSTGRIYYKKESVKQAGKMVRFFPNMTYEFEDGSSKGKWSCPQLAAAAATAAVTATQQAEIDSKIATEMKKGWKKLETLKAEGVDLTTLDKVFDKQVIGNVALFRPKGSSTTFTSGTSTADFNNDQQSFVDTFTAKGYKLNPTRLEQNSLVKVTGEQLGAPADLFPNGLVMWYDPNQQSSIRGGENSILSDILDNQSINRTTCRKNVKDFFELYRRRNSAQVDPATVDRAKRIVQACRDEHYGKWGVAGGKNVDEMLDILSGRKEGGPLSTGPTAIFRIK